MFRRLFLSRRYLAQALWVLILLARLPAVSFFLLRFITSLSIQGGELMSRKMRRGTNVFNVFFQFRDPIITNTINVGYTH